MKPHSGLGFPNVFFLYAVQMHVWTIFLFLVITVTRLYDLFSLVIRKSSPPFRDSSESVFGTSELAWSVSRSCPWQRTPIQRIAWRPWKPVCHGLRPECWMARLALTWHTLLWTRAPASVSSCRAMHVSMHVDCFGEELQGKTLPGRLELPTLRLTASRYNQLSSGSNCNRSGTWYLIVYDDTGRYHRKQHDVA